MVFEVNVYENLDWLRWSLSKVCLVAPDLAESGLFGGIVIENSINQII